MAIPESIVHLLRIGSSLYDNCLHTFENASDDKAYNLGVIRRLYAQAAARGCQVVAFHECSITGYTFTSKLSRGQLLAAAEYIPDGPSIRSLIQIARDNSIVVLAGLFERDTEENIYNTYVCVDRTGVLARFRKLHPFISPYLSVGESYAVFNLLGWKAGMLICYNNNVVENVRATALLGAEIIFAPHVTMCTPSTRPGAGFVEPGLWMNRQADSTSLRAEFDSLKGRTWLMKWLPARAYDNAVYVVFSNPVGMDHDQLKNGRAMVIDPFRDVIAECRELGEGIAVGFGGRKQFELAGGFRYRMARKPKLYGKIIAKEYDPQLAVAWMGETQA